MGGSVLVTLVIVPKSNAEGIVALSVGALLFRSIENVRRQIDSAGENGKIAGGHVVFLKKESGRPGWAFKA
jgi:hypothetical protein